MPGLPRLRARRRERADPEGRPLGQGQARVPLARDRHRQRPQSRRVPDQQAAALAAGLQKREWDYIELFYHEQGTENTNYVNDTYLDGLARQISGLNFAKWNSDRGSSSLTSQVTADQQAAASKGYNSTPTLVVTGPKGQAQAIVGDTDYGTLQQAIKSVS